MSSLNTNLMATFKSTEIAKESTKNSRVPDILEELDPATGEIVCGKVLGACDGIQDKADEVEDTILGLKEAAIQKQTKLKQCYSFLAKRLDFHLQNGVNLDFIVLRDPFEKKSTMVNDILEDVQVDTPIFDLTEDDVSLTCCNDTSSTY